MAVATVDALALFHGQAKEQEHEQKRFLESLKSTGFVRLRNHAVPEDSVRAAFAWSSKFFALPTDSKATVLNPDGPSPQRGWSRVGSEKTAKLHKHGFGAKQEHSAEELTDAREHFDIGSVDDEEFPNRWPSKLQGFEPFMEDFYRQCKGVSDQIIGALEAATGLPKGAFEAVSTRNASELRLNYYPAIDRAVLDEGKISRIWPHTDLGVITLLFQSSVGGLECQDRSQHDNFKSVEPGHTADLIVNISETMQRWSNDELLAGVHRVTRPKGMEQQPIIPERYSIAYFTKASREADVGSMPHFVAQGTQPLYESMTAQQYHRQRLATAY